MSDVFDRFAQVTDLLFNTHLVRVALDFMDKAQRLAGIRFRA